MKPSGHALLFSEYNQKTHNLSEREILLHAKMVMFYRVIILHKLAKGAIKLMVQVLLHMLLCLLLFGLAVD